MGLTREPKDVDLSIKSEPWTKEELVDFRNMMQKLKAKNTKLKEKNLPVKSSQPQSN